MTIEALKLSLPTVHLNGTSRQSLLDGYLDALNALNDVEKALVATTPNQRDYYVKKDADVAWNNAIAEHASRLARIASIKRELNALALHVSDA